MPTVLPAQLRLGPVSLAVRDLDRACRFYEQVIGLQMLTHGNGTAKLGTPDDVLLELVERKGAERDPGAAGLFHVALLLPSRADLGRWLLHAAAQGAEISGSADHIVSEAVYLDDPDGHGLEIYADRPREAWYRNGKFQIATLPLGADGIIADGRTAGGPHRSLPDGSRIGHVHLESHDVAASRTFYTETLGFDVMADWR